MTLTQRYRKMPHVEELNSLVFENSFDEEQ